MWGWGFDGFGFGLVSEGGKRTGIIWDRMGKEKMTV